MKNTLINTSIFSEFTAIRNFFLLVLFCCLSFFCQAQVWSIENEATMSLEDVFVPTAFSPDGDGLNDIFKVKINGDLLYFDMQIFDRWGTRVFVSDDPTIPWLGNNLDGLYSAGEGLYVYQLAYSYNRGIVAEKNGAVYMLK